MAQRVAVNDAATGGASRRVSRVRVAVRLRPYMEAHDDKAEGPCVRGLGPQSLEITNWRNAMETLHYQFDVFYGEQTSQQEVFLSSVKPVLPHLLNGQNASIFAYGPTGAGKTHTMLGSSEQPGVIPRAVREVFHLVREREEESQDWEYSVGMSYLEIYNEKVLDLLSPGSQDLPIREDKDRNIFIPGLTHTPLTSFSHFHTVFLPASLNRTTASTKLNQRSSRSHAILLIKVVRSQQSPPHRQQTGKLYLVDLAGSEDNRRTGNQGLRLKESGAINLSLFTLSKVVDALNAGGGCRVPYRDSKLTRLLQDSLGGSAHSVMITNIAPEYKYYFDTFTALNFAAKSKLIVNRPFVRETVSSSVPGKRPRDEQGSVGTAEPHHKKVKGGHKEGQEGSRPSRFVCLQCPVTHCGSAYFGGNPLALSPPVSSVLDRLLALEKLMMGTPERERLNLLKTVAESRKEIQELKEKQKELESRALQVREANSIAGPQPQDPALKNSLPQLHRKQSTAARPKKQQAVVSPLLVSQELAAVKKPVLCSTVKSKQNGEALGGKENVAGDECALGRDWESRLEPAVLEKSRQHILEVLNSGSLKELKALQLIGDKKAKLIMGWREVHGSFSQVEDLKNIEGITVKRFSSFLKANVLSTIGR
ncbi:kinesin-like protein KIF22 isoform X1 [Scleropages formosus]|uniref:kinesin-like protein KIF22 isoform X1 n=1 Tax=Scleropages formosus TaxID=113540 RepID=UPI0010FA9ADA|nr:kinesin-like protein KIF22 isoform X1 [Scleropages formosus]